MSHGEPTAVTIVRLSGEVVATLLVSPKKPISRLKTQIEGLEGTPAGNQSLMLEERVLADHENLSDLGVGESVTLVLLRRTPLLAGGLCRRDLEHLLRDQVALDQAIDAYSEILKYLPSEVLSIARAVSAALLPGDQVGERPRFQEEAGTFLRELHELGVAFPSGKARQVAFSRALREELEKVWGALAVIDTSTASRDLETQTSHEQTPRTPTSCEEEAEATGDATGVAGEGDAPNERPCPLVEPRRTGTGLSSGHPESTSQAAPAAHDVPWVGAGKELQHHLHRRWTACEGSLAPD
ncbi:unnamed protein product [Polarella glacialis]|uniref:Ubiquitin-like domain-containing protein n=1 Tax=Polarella glacialis TaxID=89957 RepID=A0A813GMC6_POLGL|nr:unnamed protein product [Polarella glacialis]CAE8672907.1 unnamed protein product [Polarella glacialis]